MKYIQNTDKDIKRMLKRIGVKSFEDLISTVPDKIRFKDSTDIGKKLSEFELILETGKMKNHKIVINLATDSQDN